MRVHWSTWLATLALTVSTGCYGGRQSVAEGGDGLSGLGEDGDDDGESGGDDSDYGEQLECEDGGPGVGPRMLRLLTRREYQNTVADLLGVEAPEIDGIPIEPIVEGYDNDAHASVVTSRHIDAYMTLATEVAAEAVTADPGTLVGCMPADPDCARAFVQGFGRKALRHSLSDQEVDFYLLQFDPEVTDGDFYQGVQLAVRSMLMSSAFLYRSELGEPTDDGLFRLTPYEVASSLSYTLWGTTPDEELLQAAEAGELDTADGVEQQARRLLDHPRGREQVDVFATQWMGTGALLLSNKDAEIYPSFTPEIREAMAAEQQRFIEHVVFESSGTLTELLTADYVFANDALAGFYGLSQPGSGELVQIELSGNSQRGGLLRMGSVLASHAHPNESSPVQRGVFVRERLLCQVLPLPPEDVDATPPELDPNATTRERFGQHSSDPACKSCHQLIDPLGFGFESYDGVGAFRETENGLPVDASGEVFGLDEGDSVPFDGPGELANILAETPDVQECVVEQYHRFATGREGIAADECVLEALSESFIESGTDMHELFIDWVRLPSFVLRTE